MITIDLNPLSRTSEHATVSIVDDVERAIRNLISVVKEKKRGKGKENLLEDYDNKENLKEVIGEIASRLKSEGTRK